MSGGQSRRASALEAVANVAVGLIVSLASNLIVLPLLGLPVTLSQAGAISAAFTVISLVRSFFLRRAFNYVHLRFSTKKGECDEN